MEIPTSFNLVIFDHLQSDITSILLFRLYRVRNAQKNTHARTEEHFRYLIVKIESIEQR